MLIFAFLLQLLHPSYARLNGALTPVQHEHHDSSRGISSSGSNKDSDDSPHLAVSVDIPPLQDSLELVRLSGLVYDFRAQKAKDCSSFPSIFNGFMNDESDSSPYTYDDDSNYEVQGGNFTFQCHMYERDELDTQVLVVSRVSKTSPAPAVVGTGTADPNQDYIAVVYAGTDDFRNALTDTNLLTKHFGTESYQDDDQIDPSRNYTFPPFSENIRVHAGFNNAVFKHGLFDRIYDQISAFKTKNPNARIVTTGHSLGASDAVLTAVALKIQPQFQGEVIHSINFGCPKTGNHHWKDFVNGLDGLGVWRVVNGLDLVPRLPGARFHHVGHTLQLDKRFAKLYWLHEGDRSLGYAGIPFGWNSE